MSNILPVLTRCRNRALMLQSVFNNARYKSMYRRCCSADTCSSVLQVRTVSCAVSKHFHSKFENGDNEENIKSRYNVLIRIGIAAGVLTGLVWKNYFGSGDRSIKSSLTKFIPVVSAAKPTEPGSSDSSSWLSGGSGDSGKVGNRNRDRFNFIADIVQKAAPALVYIEIKDGRRVGVFGAGPTVSNGSGFIIKEDGLILTNAHVVLNRPNSAVSVRLHDGRTFTGRIESVDLKSDLATVRIDVKGLPVLELGSSKSVRPGEWVVAMGSPLSLSNTITAGIVSSVNRDSSELGLHGRNMEYIQTDAAITFGNSGGPLINLDGEAIGINAMKVTAGISFAIPIDHAKEFLKRVESGNLETKVPKRRYMGITMISLDPMIIQQLQLRNVDIPSDVTGGVLVWRVVMASPAYNAGVRPGDIVIEINGCAIRSGADVYKHLEKSDTINMQIVRGGSRHTLTITPE